MKLPGKNLRKIFVAVLAMTLAAGICAASPAGEPSVFASDKGKLRTTISGQTVGSEEFEISPSGDVWIERSSTTAHSPGGPDIKAPGQLRLSAAGEPIHYDWSAQAQKKATGSVEFSGGKAKCAADLGATNPLRKDFSFTFGARRRPGQQPVLSIRRARAEV